MMSARERIFAKLRAAPKQSVNEPDLAQHYQQFSPAMDKISQLRHWAATMRSVKTEVIWVHRETWAIALSTSLQSKNIPNLLLAHTPEGEVVADALANTPCATRYFEQSLDTWKEAMFNEVAAGFTTCLCGIAATGTLVLWPNNQQPRSMSLVPPIHFALFDTETLYPDFYSAIHSLNWAAGMPTNAILVSGPSKTADIQLTLAYGAHGPRELIVLALLPDSISLADVEESV